MWRLWMISFTVSRKLAKKNTVGRNLLSSSNLMRALKQGMKLTSKSIKRCKNNFYNIRMKQKTSRIC